jgi:hypothetical protein
MSITNSILTAVIDPMSIAGTVLRLRNKVGGNINGRSRDSYQCDCEPARQQDRSDCRLRRRGLLALTVVLLGTATGNRSFIGAGIAFLVVFVTAFFYGIEMTMLEKSITLVATGAAVLFAR